MQLNYVKPWHATDLRIRTGPEKLKNSKRVNFLLVGKNRSKKDQEMAKRN